MLDQGWYLIGINIVFTFGVTSLFTRPQTRLVMADWLSLRCLFTNHQSRGLAAITFLHFMWNQKVGEAVTVTSLCEERRQLLAGRAAAADCAWVSHGPIEPPPKRVTAHHATQPNRLKAAAIGYKLINYISNVKCFFY